jgi:hypothetical protein
MEGKRGAAFAVIRSKNAASQPKTEKAFAARGECLSNFALVLDTEGHTKSQLYGLFTTTCGAGLLTSSCALTFWICADCSLTVATRRSTVPSNSAILFC